MNHSLEACLIMILTIANTHSLFGQSQTVAAQAMQNGISVQLPVASNAQAMP
jgi:hypothetical protein